jgi:quinol-cytochrome oxidoreductase complex cytochrome b subunit
MPSAALYRLAGAAGVLSALVLLVNVARRTGLVPANELTHGIAPLTLVFGLFALTGLYLWLRAESGTTGLVGYALNAVGLAGVLGIEFSINFVFPYLDKTAVTALLDGPTGTAFRVVAVVFLVGVVIFGVAAWRARRLPAAAVALYVVGLAPVSLRGAIPDSVVNVAYVVAAAGTAWLGYALWTAASRRGRTAS